MANGILMDVEAEVSKVEKSGSKDLSVVKLITLDGTNISLEVPHPLLQLKGGEKIRLVISTDPNIEHDVNGLLLCTIYSIEKIKSGKEERTFVYGSIGGLQARMEGKGLHKKFKMGDKVYLGIKLL